MFDSFFCKTAFKLCGLSQYEYIRDLLSDILPNWIWPNISHETIGRFAVATLNTIGSNPCDYLSNNCDLGQTAFDIGKEVLNQYKTEIALTAGAMAVGAIALGCCCGCCCCCRPRITFG